MSQRARAIRDGYEDAGAYLATLRDAIDDVELRTRQVLRRNRCPAPGWAAAMCELAAELRTVHRALWELNRAGWCQADAAMRRQRGH